MTEIGKRQWVLGLFFVVFLAQVGLSQSVSGTITGVVTDPSGAAIPGAEITVTNTKTGLSKTTTSDASGVYSIPLLQPSVYTVKVTHEGFSTVERTNVPVEVNQVTTLNLAMPLGQARQTVTVAANAEPLMTTQSGTGQVLESVQVHNLPLQNLDIFGLLNVMPGLV